MPKRYRNLWPELVGFANLWAAYLATRRGKRGRPAVSGYELDAEIRLLRLQERLEAGTYQPGAYRTFVVREWKRRVISAAPFEDRIIHHAICRTIEPIFECRFIHDSYACRCIRRRIRPAGGNTRASAAVPWLRGRRTHRPAGPVGPHGLDRPAGWQTDQATRHDG